MDYFRIIHLIKEPFSNSPDPEYFFQSRQHVDCLQKLELALRLRRGLNVVVGDVGTGKTTLCRQLIRRFAGEDDCETHLILDPHFSSSSEFLATVAEMFAGAKPAPDANDWQLKEIIKKHIFKKGVDENRIVVLIIDEGQKIPDFCLEILREFLNFETNDSKLLQIAIFAQKEFETTLDRYANFADRINLHHTLGPLSFKDTRQMIRFRIRQSSGSPRPPALFTLPALWKIYRASGGYPRKIVNFCHRSVLTMIVQNRTRAGWMLVRSCVRRSAPGRLRKWPARAGAALVIAAAFVFAVGLFSDKVDVPDLFKTGRGRAVGAPDVPRNSLTAGSVPDHAPAAALLPGSDPAAGAVAVSSVQAGSELLPEQRAMPSLLGRVVLKQNETLWRLIERAYGRFDYELQKLLLAANPEIADPNRVEAGTVISVPAVPIEVKPLQQTLYWVRLAEKSRLEAAIEVLRAYPAEAPPIRIVPYCGAAGEIRFAILDREFFPDKDSAAKRLALLPTSFLDRAEIFSAWRERTVFFADPYRVKK